ncbi:nicotinamide mononucleotide transporter [Niabella sp. W65]|nr:nicotinamide mononucleotide transporter [Niabella sp. W65]MCH7361423.1 nicotinamide mononucleotide transporter [Niabella sp. W65]
MSATAWAGMWLLAKRKIENWILLNISNAFAIPLLFYKGLPLYALLTLFLFIIAVLGYIDWNKTIKKNEQKQLLALNKERINHLRKLCKDAEKKGSLPNALLKIAYEEKWFKLFLPKVYGGLELDLPEALRYEEQLAYIDGSLGWTITLCAGANLLRATYTAIKRLLFSPLPKYALEAVAP